MQTKSTEAFLKLADSKINCCLLSSDYGCHIREHVSCKIDDSKTNPVTPVTTTTLPPSSPYACEASGTMVCCVTFWKTECSTMKKITLITTFLKYSLWRKCQNFTEKNPVITVAYKAINCKLCPIPNHRTW